MVAIDDSLPHLQFESDFKSRFGQTKTQVKPEKEVANESKIHSNRKSNWQCVDRQPIFFSQSRKLHFPWQSLAQFFFPIGLFLSKIKSSLEATDIFNFAETFIDAIN